MRSAVAASVAAALVGAIALTGCGSVGASKSGGGEPPISIRLATGDPQGRPSSDEVEVFAAAVERLSEGTIQVEVAWESFLGALAGDPAGANAYEGETYGEVARQLEGGEVELAFVPDFAWVEHGAESLRALKVPFLIDSVALMSETARRFGAEALASLPDLGVVPLAVMPESLRHPLAFGDPILRSSDLRDRKVRTVDTSAAPIFEAWGAEPVRLEGSFGPAVTSGEVTAADSAYVQVGTLPASAVFTGDVSYLAKFITLAAAGDWWERISGDQRAAIQEAATLTLEHAVSSTPDDREAGEAFCAAGGAIVHAGAAAAQFEALAQPLIDEVRDDPSTMELVQSITALKAEMPPAVPAAACSPEPTDPVTDPGQATEFPEGTFRAVLTVEDFTERGVDESTARNHKGVWTLTFRDGEVLDIGCPGSTYSVVDGRVSVVLGTGANDCGTVAGQELFSATWTFDGQVLRFHNVGPGAAGPLWQTFSEVIWGSQDWVKIA